jgi:hypothetical protein
VRFVYRTGSGRSCEDKSKVPRDKIRLLKKDKTDRIFPSAAYEAPIEMVDSLVLRMIEMLVSAEHLVLGSRSQPNHLDSAFPQFEEH